jgi:hypothetical protein
MATTPLAASGTGRAPAAHDEIVLDLSTALAARLDALRAIAAD